MRFICFTIFFLLVGLKTSAQQSKTTVEHAIRSAVFKTERKISVYLPIEEEKADKPERYAVAYVFDGQFEPYTGMVNSMIQYYAGAGEGIPMIVVGIHTDKRWEEFVPSVENDQLVTGEAADQLSDFLSKEVFPLVDSLYPVKPFRLGVGHSLGGTFVLYEIMKENPLFNAVISVSPNLTMYNEYLVRKGKIFFEKGTEKPLFIYTSAGTFGNPEKFFIQSLSNLDSIYQQVKPAGIYWYCDRMKGENHMTTFVPTFNKGYLELSSRLMLTDRQLVALAADTTREITESIKTVCREMSLFSGEGKELNSELLIEIGKQLTNLGQFGAVVALSESAKKLLEKEDVEDKKALIKKMDARIEWSRFNLLAEKAQLLMERKAYKASAAVYKEAFAMNVINGTHVTRIYAVPVLAQAGELELAFKQLELLAETFELGGNNAFIDNPLCDPLKTDPRWTKYMEKLKKNGSKYK